MIPSMHHVTLQTGHVAMQPRSVVSDHTVTIIGAMLDDLLVGEYVPLPDLPGYAVNATRKGTALIATLWRIEGSDRIPVLTTGVAFLESDSGHLWQCLHARGAAVDFTTRSRPAPPTPWIADCLELGLNLLDPITRIDLLRWTGDWARCLGWSWWEYVNGLEAPTAQPADGSAKTTEQITPIIQQEAQDGMPEVFPLAIGEKVSVSLRYEGLRAEITVTDDVPAITLWAGAKIPLPSEIEAMRSGKLRISILPAPPLVWIILDAGGGLTFDAPYAPGLDLDPAGADAWGADWTDKQRALVLIPFLDAADGTVRSLRGVSLSRSWMRQLGQAVARCSVVSRQDVEAAIRRDMTRWPTTRQMIRAAKMMELAGR